MDTAQRQPGDPPSDAQLRRELQAVVAAQQELGEGFGIELADAFVERLHAAIDQRIEARLKQRGNGLFSLVLPIASFAAGLLARAIAGPLSDLLREPARSWFLGSLSSPSISSTRSARAIES